MPFALLLRHQLKRLFTKVGWASLAALIFVHMSVSFLGLAAFGEEKLTAPVAFIYYYITTTTTVGYGDLSPATDAGRLFVVSWVMLGGIALLTAVIGKSTNTVIEVWRREMKGKGTYASCVGHTVVVGWEGPVTERVVELLHEDETSNDHLIVLCDASLEENPLPDLVEFIKGESLSSAALLERAGVRNAERVLVRTGSDDLTLATVLTINSLNPAGHVVAHFSSSETAQLARTYAPRLECTSSMAIELLVRSSQDPGSSVVINELLSVGQGATQYRMVLPENKEGTFGELYTELKARSNATLIGYRPKGSAKTMINPPIETLVSGGELFYIASARLKDL
jgi:voltage-gated potassium channel